MFFGTKTKNTFSLDLTVFPLFSFEDMHLGYEILLNPYYVTVKAGSWDSYSVSLNESLLLSSSKAPWLAVKISLVLGTSLCFLIAAFTESLTDSLKLKGVNGQQPTKGQGTMHCHQPMRKLNKSNQKIMIVQVPLYKHQIDFFFLV